MIFHYKPQGSFVRQILFQVFLWDTEDKIHIWKKMFVCVYVHYKKSIVYYFSACHNSYNY